MSENPTPAAATPTPAPDSSAAVKRYAPPNQRNRSLNRRKSGGFDRSNNVYVNDGEKNQHSVSSGGGGGSGGGNVMNESTRSRLIPLEGCSRSEAVQFLNDRFDAVMQRYNDPTIDLSERPVMYSGSGASAWTNFRLPHQIVPPQNNVGPSSKMRNAPASSDN